MTLLDLCQLFWFYRVPTVLSLQIGTGDVFQFAFTSAFSLSLQVVSTKAWATLCNGVPGPPVTINSTTRSPLYLINGSAQTTSASVPSGPFAKS